MRVKLATLAALTLIGSFTYLSSAQAPANQPPQGDRKLTPKQFEGMPVKIREIRNLNKGDDWFRDLEIEVENVSDRPIYFVSLGLRFPDIPAAPPPPRADGLVYASSHTGFPIRFGDPRLVDISELPAPEDTPLLPGQTHVFRIPESRVPALEYMKRKKGVSDEATKRLELNLNVVSFGDGTGFLAGRRLSYPRHRLRLPAEQKPPTDQPFRKINWRGSARPRVDNFDGCGSCFRMKVVKGDQNFFCVGPETLPPVICFRDQAMNDPDGSCMTIGRDDFDCGGSAEVPPTPCHNDTPDICSAEPDPTPPSGGGGGGGGGRPDGCGGDCSLRCLEVGANCDPWCQCYTPIVIDTAGDGVRLTDARNGVSFDIDADPATANRLGWTEAGSDDAWLALDRNRNGAIDDGTELFGDRTPQAASDHPNGFLALAEFDKAANGGNGDGSISGRDAIFASLRLWQDTNHNGVSEATELRTMEGMGLVAIGLDFDTSKRRDAHGNVFRYRAKVEDARGQQLGRWAWDVFLVPARGQAAQTPSRIRPRAFDQIAGGEGLYLPAVPFIKTLSACSQP